MPDDPAEKHAAWRSDPKVAHAWLKTIFEAVNGEIRLPPPSSTGEPAWAWHPAACLKKEFGLQLQPGANVVLELAEQSEQPEPSE